MYSFLYNQVFCIRQVDDVVCPARDHVNCFDLIPAYFKLHHLSSVNISLLDQAMVCLFYSWDTELSTGHSILIFRGPWHSYFLESGKVPEQGYKACASLRKLGERYGKKRLETACMNTLAYGATPSIRNISSILKSKQSNNTSASWIRLERVNAHFFFPTSPMGIPPQHFHLNSYFLINDKELMR